MSYRVNFLDNQEVTAAYLNSITSSLSGGVLSFEDNMTYGVNALNEISGNLIGKGVTSGCGLSVSGSEVIVGSGVLYMSDGKRVEIDAEGIRLEFAAGAQHYVWFYHDTVTGFVVPRCTTEVPTGDYVLLGEITAAGTVEGRPERAFMKNASVLPNASATYTIDELPMSSPSGSFAKVYEIDVGPGYKFAKITPTNIATTSSNYFSAFFDFDTGEYFGVIRNHSVPNGNDMTSTNSLVSGNSGVYIYLNGSSYVRLKLIYNNGVIEFWINRANAGSYTTAVISLEVI